MASPTLELFCSGSRAEIALKKLPALSPKQEILGTFGRSGWSAETAYLPSRLKYLAKAKPLEIDGSLISVALSYEGDWTAEKE